MTSAPAGLATTGLMRRSRFARKAPASTQARRRWPELILAVSFYLGFACYQTWPLVTALGHDLYGAAGDPYGAMAFFRALVEHHHNPFLPGTIKQYSAPEGQPIPWPQCQEYLMPAAIRSYHPR